MHYDDSLDPISPNFDRAHFEHDDTPMLDERGPLVVHPDRVRDLIQFHTSHGSSANPMDRVPVSMDIANRLARRMGRKIDTLRAMHIRLLRDYPAVRRSDFERRA